MGIVQVGGTILQEDTQRFVLRLADKGRIDVPPPDVGKTSDMADHLAKEIGTFPGGRKGTDSTRTHPADRPHGGIIGELVGFPHLRKDLLLEKGHIVGAQRVVFHAAVSFYSRGGFPPLPPVELVGKEPRIEKDPDRDRHLALVDQIIKDDRHADVTRLVHIGMAILEDHHRGRLAPVILGGHVKIPLPQRPLEDSALPLVTSNLAPGHAILAL